MDLYTNLASFDLTGFALAFVVLGIVAAVVSVAVIAEFVVTNRRARVARHESIRSYYHRPFAPTH